MGFGRRILNGLTAKAIVTNKDLEAKGHELRATYADHLGRVEGIGGFHVAADEQRQIAASIRDNGYQFEQQVRRGEWSSNGLGHLGMVAGRVAKNTKEILREEIDFRVNEAVTLPCNEPGTVTRYSRR